MKRLLHSCIIGTILIVGCTDYRYKVNYSPSYKDDPVRKKLVMDYIMKMDPISAEMKLSGTKLSQMDYIDSCLKDWPFPNANGNWIPSRDGLENCDTIVDGCPYNHV
jgi:hypothetical protein